MGSNEDCASVLDSFIHDVANLPLEINHMMEEIQAKDREMQKYTSMIAAKDGNLQKHVKANGSMTPHPKESEYSQSISNHFTQCQDLQDQKIGLSDKACILLDRQIKRLDSKIKELQNEGLLSNDPPMPSLFNRKAQHPDSGRNFFVNLIPTDSTPLQITSGNAAHPAGVSQRMIQTQLTQPIPNRAPQIASSATHPRNSAPATPASAAQHIQQRHRELSAGAVSEAKRRRLNATIPNMPAQSSNLRQTSLGPGTPKAGTPSGSTRAGSAGPRSTAGAAKRPTNKTTKLSHQQVSKLKGKASNKRSSSLSSSSHPLKKKSGNTARNSPSVRVSGEPDEDSVLSSADVSDADSHATGGPRSRRTNKTGAGNDGAHDENDPDISMEDEEADAADDDDEEIEQEDTREYCFCHKVSYGEMVGCENKDCPYEWFHLDCVGLKKAPGERDTWYCRECEAKGFKSHVYGNVYK